MPPLAKWPEGLTGAALAGAGVLVVAKGTASLDELAEAEVGVGRVDDGGRDSASLPPETTAWGGGGGGGRNGTGDEVLALRSRAKGEAGGTTVMWAWGGKD